MSGQRCPACGDSLPEWELALIGDEIPDEAEDNRHDSVARLPDGTPSELRRFCPSCRERLKESK